MGSRSARLTLIYVVVLVFGAVAGWSSGPRFGEGAPLAGRVTKASLGLFWGEGSPTKIDRNKLVSLF